MEFWLQKTEEFDIDIEILKSILNKEKYQHTYRQDEMSTYMKLINYDATGNLQYMVPVGNLDFVQTMLKSIHNVDRMNPIEVPDVLREEMFLKRKYSIIDGENLPKKGSYFIKYVSKLKEFTCIGNSESLHYNGRLKDGLYQVSEIIDIKSEYRVFVAGDVIKAINFYDGNPEIFPDIDLIVDMVNTYKQDLDRPKAYTMDVAVAKNRGTLILEVHPWVSVGLYGYIFPNSLPYFYRDGFLYYVQSNKELNTWSNFSIE